MAAHQGNLTELVAGYLALGRSRDPEVRRIAIRLINDHAELDAQVRVVAHRLGVVLPETPTGEQLRQLAKLAAKRGREFDLAWLRLQERMHLETLTQIRQEERQGCSPLVRGLARAAAPVITEHLRMIRAALQDG